MKNYIHDFIDLLFPTLCQACGRNLHQGERLICLPCDLDLPRTNYHLQLDNRLVRMFWGDLPIVGAAAFFRFETDTGVQSLLHQLKYQGQQAVGVKLGRAYGLDLRNTSPFNTVHALIPVPLHPSKQKSRGYNQSECIAKGLSEAMGIPMLADGLMRRHATKTQTHKTALERAELRDGLFEIGDSLPDRLDLHVLLVDDVITTGSTMRACAAALMKVPGIRISLAALAAVDP